MNTKKSALPGQKQSTKSLSDVPYAQVLTAELEAAQDLKKSDRTRMRITAAAAQVLEEQGYHAMRVADACTIAEVSQGTFYLYFKNKNEVACAVLHDFNQRGLALLAEQGPSSSPWRSIHSTTLSIARIYSQNPGLMRSLWQIDDETPEFGEILRDANAVWIRTVAQSITRRCGVGAEGSQKALFMAYALGAMVDQFLISLFVTRDPHVGELGLGVEQAAEMLSVMWFRAAFCGDPPADVLKYNSSLEMFQLPEPGREFRQKE